MPAERSEHIGQDVLIDFLENRADAATAELVAAHLKAGCRECSQRLAFWSRVVAALEVGRTTDPPERVLQEAFSLFDRFANRRSVWEQITAALVFDSRGRAALAGARDSGAVSFDLLYEAADTSIYLHCEREGRGWQVDGQVVPGGAPEMGWAVVVTGTVGTAAADTDESGEFRLRGVAPGTYEMVLTNPTHPGRKIIVPHVVLRAS